jgi:hypothetical protein
LPYRFHVINREKRDFNLWFTRKRDLTKVGAATSGIFDRQGFG